MRWYNKSYVGVQFGGSVYAMIDPFYMMKLINNTGEVMISVTTMLYVRSQSQ